MPGNSGIEYGEEETEEIKTPKTFEQLINKLQEDTLTLFNRLKSYAEGEEVEYLTDDEFELFKELLKRDLKKKHRPTFQAGLVSIVEDANTRKEKEAFSVSYEDLCTKYLTIETLTLLQRMHLYHQGVIRLPNGGVITNLNPSERNHLEVMVRKSIPSKYWPSFELTFYIVFNATRPQGNFNEGSRSSNLNKRELLERTVYPDNEQ